MVGLEVDVIGRGFGLLVLLLVKVVVECFVLVCLLLVLCCVSYGVCVMFWV